MNNNLVMMGVVILFTIYILCGSNEKYTPLNASDFERTDGKTSIKYQNYLEKIETDLVNRIGIINGRYKLAGYINDEEDIVNFIVPVINEKLDKNMVYVHTAFQKRKDETNITEFTMRIHIYDKAEFYGVDVSYLAILNREVDSLTIEDIAIVNMVGNIAMLENDDQAHPQYTRQDLKSKRKVLFTEQRIKSGLAEQRKAAAKKSFMCFNSTNPGARTKEECNLAKGVWDIEPANSAECPYFQKNKNYPNQRGGLRNGGYCDLPKNTQAVGFRYESSSPQYKPQCYNCKTHLVDNTGKSTIGACCEEQRLDRTTYHKLKSPDYAFPGDALDRGHHRREFESKGLSVS